MATNPTTHYVPLPPGVAELNGDIYTTSASDGGLYKNYVYLTNIGASPYFITSDGIRYLYISIYGSICIVKYDTTNDTFVTSGSLEARPQGIYYYNANLYVNVGRKVQIVNPINLTVTNSNFIGIPGGADALGINGRDNYLYITNGDGHRVYKYNLNGEIDNNFHLAYNIDLIDVAIIQSYIFVSSSQGGVYQFDLNGNFITQFTNTPCAIQMLFYNNYFYVASQVPNAIYQYSYQYLENPTITDFAIPVKTFGDSSFPIAHPSSTSNGAFSYTSSDESVATILGDIITIVAPGTSTITATQAATEYYTSGTITTIFIVCQPIATGNDLLTFTNVDPTIVYGNILDPIEIDNDLLSANYKVLFANDPNVTITKI